jgi:hypothetical protein
MAPRKRSASADLSPAQAQYVVRRLLADRAIRINQVRGYLAELNTEIATLEQQLAFLRDASGQAGARTTSAGRSRQSTGGAADAPRRRNISPERREALRLQGHYLALIRQVPARQRGQYKAMVEKRGKEAAIAALRRAVEK